MRNATPDGIDHLLVLVVATALAFDFTNGFHELLERRRDGDRDRRCGRVSPFCSQRC